MDRETWHALYVEHVLANNEIIAKAEDLEHYETIYSIVSGAVEHLLQIGIEKNYIFNEINTSHTTASILDQTHDVLEKVDDEILYEDKKDSKKSGFLEKLEKEFKE